MSRQELKTFPFSHYYLQVCVFVFPSTHTTTSHPQQPAVLDYEKTYCSALYGLTRNTLCRIPNSKRRKESFPDDILPTKPSIMFAQPLSLKRKHFYIEKSTNLKDLTELFFCIQVFSFFVFFFCMSVKHVDKKYLKRTERKEKCPQRTFAERTQSLLGNLKCFTFKGVYISM